jgi:5'-3' exonuclease
MQSQLSFKIDLESVIDDFVLLCFFVGNDFVPTLPGLGMRKDKLLILMPFLCINSNTKLVNSLILCIDSNTKLVNSRQIEGHP